MLIWPERGCVFSIGLASMMTLRLPTVFARHGVATKALRMQAVHNAPIENEYLECIASLPRPAKPHLYPVR